MTPLGSDGVMPRPAAGRDAQSARARARTPEWTLLWLAVLAVACFLPLVVWAQVAEAPVGSRVRVANTEGQGLNLRETPSRSGAVVARPEEGTVLLVIERQRQAEGLAWLRLREPGGKVGWGATDFLTLDATPTAAPTATATATTVASVGGPTTAAADPTVQPDPSAADAAQPEPTATMVAPAGESEPTPEPTATPTPRPSTRLELDAKLKYPETDGREQTLAVRVTKNRAPVPEAQVIVVTQNADPPIIRELDQTNDEGRTNRTWDVRREKGTVVLVVIAVAPDGAKGQEVVSYFRR